jgi:hypothetical protein
MFNFDSFSFKAWISLSLSTSYGNSWYQTLGVGWQIGLTWSLIVWTSASDSSPAGVDIRLLLTDEPDDELLTLTDALRASGDMDALVLEVVGTMDDRRLGLGEVGEFAAALTLAVRSTLMEEGATFFRVAVGGLGLEARLRVLETEGEDGLLFIDVFLPSVEGGDVVAGFVVAVAAPGAACIPSSDSRDFLFVTDGFLATGLSDICSKSR